MDIKMKSNVLSNKWHSSVHSGMEFAMGRLSVLLCMLLVTTVAGWAANTLPDTPQQAVSVGKTVTNVNGNISAENLAKLVDGSNNVDQVPLLVNGVYQSFIVDLGEQYPITTINFDWEGATAKVYKVYLSSDNSNWDEVIYETNNTAQGGKNHVNKDYDVYQTGRYVKVETIEAGNTGWGCKLNEVTVNAYPKSTTNEVSSLCIYSKSNTASLDSTIDFFYYVLDASGYVVMNPGENFVVNVKDPDESVTNITGQHTYTFSKLGTYLFTYAGPEGLNDTFTVTVPKTSQKLALSEDMVWVEEGCRMTGVANAFDGTDSVWELHADTRATGGNKNYESGFILDLKGYYDISSIYAKYEGACPADYIIAFSSDGSSFTAVKEVIGHAGLQTYDETYDGFNNSVNEGVRYVQFYSSKAATEWGIKIMRFDITAAKVESAVNDGVGPTVGTEVAVAGKTSADITVTATDDSGEYVYYKLEQVAPAGGPTITDRFTSMRSGEAATFTLTGLTAETAYRFHVTAYDVFGNATTLEDVTFQTLGDVLKTISVANDQDYAQGTSATTTPSFTVYDIDGDEIPSNDPKLELRYIVLSNEQGIINTTGLSTDETFDKPYNSTGVFTLDPTKKGVAAVRIYGIYTDGVGNKSYSDENGCNYYINVYDSALPLTVTSFKIGDTTYNATNNPTATFTGTAGNLKDIINAVVGRSDAYLDVEDLQVEGSINNADVSVLRRMAGGHPLNGTDALVNENVKREKVRIYVKTINGSDAPWIHAWNGDNDKINGDFPGRQMTMTAAGYWVQEFDTAPTGIVITKVDGSNYQSNNLAVSGVDNYYIYDSKYVLNTYREAKSSGVLKNLDLSAVAFSDGGGTYLSRWFQNVYTPTGITGGNVDYNVEFYMFYDCDNLETIVLPSTVSRNKYVGQYAFFDCDGLRTVTYAPDTKKIDAYAFEKCAALDVVTLPSTLEEIGYDVFRDCRQMSLSTAQLPNSIKSIDDWAFAGTSVSSVILPANPEYTKVFTHVFGWCNSLTDLVIPSNVSNIGYGAFNNCPILENVTIDPNCVITDIDNVAFSGDKKITSETVNRLIRDLTVLNNEVFNQCESVTDVNIPASVTTLRNLTFANCTGLTSITVNSATAPSGYEVTNGEMKYDNGNASNPFNNVVPNNVTVTFANDAVEGYASYREGTKKNNAFKYLLTKTLDENNDVYNCVLQQHADVELVRTFKKRWNTIALPFALNADKLASTFGAGTKVAYYANWNKTGSDANTDDDVLMFYTTTYTGGGEADWQNPNTGDVNTTEDGMSQTRPYIIMLEDGETSDNIDLPAAGFYLAEDVDLVYGTNGDETHKPDAFKNETTYGSTYAFKGTLNKINSLVEEEKVNVLYIKNNKFWTRTTESEKKTSLKPFRGYFTFPKTAGAKDNNIILMSIMDNDNTTAIDRVDGEEVVNVTVVDGVYDLSGRKVYDRPNATMKPGVYIVNGKKMIVK